MESLRKLAKHCAVTVFLWIFCLPALSEENVSYRVTIIKTGDGNYLSPGSKGRSAINNIGQIISYEHCFLWSPSKGIQYQNDLYSGILPISYLLYPYDTLLPINIDNWCPTAINDNGQVIGFYANKYNNYEYFYLSFLLNQSGDAQYLGYLASRPAYTYANRINNAGQIIGNSAYTYPYLRNFHAFLLNPGSDIQDLTPLLLPSYPNTSLESKAVAINDKGQIIGRFGYSNFLFDPISGVQLNFIDQYFSTKDINNVGQIVGTYRYVDEEYSELGRAFIWRSLSPSQKEFEYLFPENLKGEPFDINNLGDVVGRYKTGDYYPNDFAGFIWSKSNGLQKLDDLIDPVYPLKPYLTIIDADGINDNGQIVGTARIIEPPETISPCPSDQWSCNAVILLTPTTSSPSLTINLLDPVPSLLEGSAVSTNPDSLAKKGRLVEGVGADGVATLVLRIHASSVGESITLTLDGPSTDEAGALGVLGATPDALTTTVTAESTTEGPMAFALYRAPVDFAWNESHHNLQRRSVTLSASSSSGGSATKPIDVIRPPVVLVHGLWSDSSTWSEFTPLISDKAFDIYKFNYKSTNAEAIKINSDKLLISLHLIVGAFSDANNVAIAQVDLVAHSMGGLIARSLPVHKNDYLSQRNFNEGYIHKLITIGTPHLGSPLARELIKLENACFSSTLKMDAKADGAVGDLVGNGDGTGLSLALTRLQNLPMAMIAGQVGGVLGLPFPTRLVLKKLVCNAPIIDMITYDHYESLMGTKKHDGIVPVTSALNNQKDWLFEHAIHSEGTAYLGMLGNNLLEGNSLISEKVTELLNTPATSMEFNQP